MANTKRSIRRNNHTTSQLSTMRDSLVYAAAAIVATSPSDISLMPLTRSQRLQLGQLAATTGVATHLWVRRAIDNFLADEAPVWTAKAFS